MEKKMIGRRIQELRRNQGLSQEQIAEKADISPNYLSRIECGKENPTLDMLIKLSHALEVEMWEMFDFGHIRRDREIKDEILAFTKSADTEKLRLALKIIRAVSR